MDGEDALQLVPGSGLGILREADETALFESQFRRAAAAGARARARAVADADGDQGEYALDRASPGLHRLHRGQALRRRRRSDRRAPLPRAVHVDGLQRTRLRGAAGARQGASEVAERAGLAPASHLGKALAHILETYPRDELFQISTDELSEIANGILQLGERQRFRLFVRRDPFERFVSCLIFVPRENYTTELRRKFQSILLEAFDGSAADFDVLLTDAVLARIHITVRTTPGRMRQVRSARDRSAAGGRRAALGRRPARRR